MATPRPRIDFYFSFVSLWSYIGSLAFQNMVRRLDAEVNFRPVDLLKVFAATDGKPVRERALERQAYRLAEMTRWRDLRNIPLVLHPKFYPADPSTGHRMLLLALQEGRDVMPFVHLSLKAVWADELDIADEATLVGLADAGGLQGSRLLSMARQKPRKEEAEITEEALGRGVFGAPFFFYRGEPFWGQDRLEMLEAAIASGRAPILFHPTQDGVLQSGDPR